MVTVTNSAQHYQAYINAMAEMGQPLTDAQIADLVAPLKKSRRQTWSVHEKEEELDMKYNAFIYPYNNYSKGAKALSEATKIPIMKRGRSWPEDVARNPKNYTVIHWGSGDGLPAGFNVVNDPRSIQKCGNKLAFFNLVKDTVRIPEFTDDLDTAIEWGNSGKEVLGRSVRGSCGRDIVFFSEDFDAWSTSDFWVLYKKKKAEYRVHIAFGKVVAIQQKAVRTTDPEGNPIPLDNLDYRIQNLSHGFVFKRMDITVPNDVVNQAQLAIQTVGLDFGAVDVIYNRMEDKAYVLEINTAPGLEGTTVEDYANAFREHFERKAA